jgi:hypothetical protein
MGDLVLGLSGFLIIIAGLTIIVIMVKTKRHRDAIARRNLPQRLRKERRELDTYIDRINRATTDDELDSLEQRKDE